MPNKYNAIKATSDGFDFDSKVERDYYHVLKMMQLGGAISELEVHPVFKLEFYGHLLGSGRYRADFAYVDADGQSVVVDVKGGKVQQTWPKTRDAFMILNTSVRLVEVRRSRGIWAEKVCKLRRAKA